MFKKTLPFFDRRLSLMLAVSSLIPLATLWTTHRLTESHRQILTVGILILLAQLERRRRLHELQRRNEALEEAVDGIATFDKNFRYTWLNANFSRIAGYEVHEMLGDNIGQMLHPDDLPTVAEARAEMFARRRSEREVRVRRKDGSLAYVQAVLVRCNDGKSGFCFAKDITSQKEAEHALRAMEERFRLAMRATRDVVFDWDLVGNNAWVSDAIHTELGYPRETGEEMVRWLRSIHPEDYDRVMAAMSARLADASEYWIDEYRIRRYDGAYIHIIDRVCIVRDEDGRALRLVGAMTDITAHRQLIDELERLSAQNRMILATAADGLFGIDTEGRATFVNAAASDLLGWSDAELDGKVLHDVVHPRELDGTCLPWEKCPLRRTVLEGKPFAGKATYWHKDGTPIAVELSSRPMFDAAGTVVGGVVTFRDITARVAVERMKDEFISVVSHELRTPLTSIRGALGLVAGGRAGEVAPKMARMLEIAVSNTDRLVRLINDILDIEKMEAGTITLSRQLCEAAVLIEDAIESVKPLADQAGIRLVAGPAEGTTLADRDRLLQTLTNLIGNAIKFSPRDTAVTVSATVDGRDIRFCIEDEGRGIPKEKLESIFERFQQVDATDSREKGGSGLGLAICRNIVRQHGGEIHAESDGRSGSRFLFSVPHVRKEIADAA